VFSQLYASAGSARNQPLLFVKDVAFEEADDPAGRDHFCLSAKPRVPNGPQKIDFQLNGNEAVALMRQWAQPTAALSQTPRERERGRRQNHYRAACNNVDQAELHEFIVRYRAHTTRQSVERPPWIANSKVLRENVLPSSPPLILPRIEAAAQNRFDLTCVRCRESN
jgi:hypothetical protein